MKIVNFLNKYNIFFSYNWDEDECLFNTTEVKDNIFYRVIVENKSIVTQLKGLHPIIDGIRMRNDFP